MPKFIVRYSYNYSLEIESANYIAAREQAGNFTDEQIMTDGQFSGLEIDVEQVD